MESQINSLETRIEKMQERFNKDLEEIKKSQYIMNNAINEIKNTLEGTNSRIMEAEDRISEVENISRTFSGVVVSGWKSDAEETSQQKKLKQREPPWK